MRPGIILNSGRISEFLSDKLACLIVNANGEHTRSAAELTEGLLQVVFNQQLVLQGLSDRRRDRMGKRGGLALKLSRSRSSFEIPRENDLRHRHGAHRQQKQHRDLSSQAHGQRPCSLGVRWPGIALDFSLSFCFDCLIGP